MLIVGAFIGQDVDAKSGRRAKKRIALTTFWNTTRKYVIVIWTQMQMSPIIRMKISLNWHVAAQKKQVYI